MARKVALVTGAGGFIGWHMVKYLKNLDYKVIGVDLKYPVFEPTDADKFHIYDLREPNEVNRLFLTVGPIDEVYQLAADMGGMGFISFNEVECLTNNVRININMVEAAVKHKVKRYFYSSSVCIYPNMQWAPPISEQDAYPALPDNEYGWEKLYSERVALAYGRTYEMPVRIGRFQNCYGPMGTWEGGREKAPAAICRKVAMAKHIKRVEIWGDGSAIRNFIYIDDLVDAVYKLTQSDIKEPANIGTDEYVSINDLVDIVQNVAGTKYNVEHIPGPIGVQARNFTNELIKSTGWTPTVSLGDGIQKTYAWIAEQVELKYHVNKS